MGFLYCKTINNGHLPGKGKKIFRIAHIITIGLTLFNFIILNVEQFAGKNLFSYYKMKKVQIIIVYNITAISSVIGLFLSKKQKNEKYVELRTEMTEQNQN